MADRGIIFSAAMVRALLEGRKTQTRQLVKPVMKPGVNPDFSQLRAYRHGSAHFDRLWMLHGSEEASEPFKVPYAPGDRLYVRERFRFFAAAAGDDCEVTYDADGRHMHTGPCTGDIPDPSLARYFKMVDRSKKAASGVNYPSIHMPRWASRLTLTVNDVRVQRVQEIGEFDAKAEGLEQGCIGGLLPACRGTPDLDWRIYADSAFADLWNSLHTKPGETWEANPWIVAVSFSVAHGNIDRSN